MNFVPKPCVAALGVLFDRRVLHPAVPGVHVAIALHHPRHSPQPPAAREFVHSCNTRPAQCTKNYNWFHQRLYDYASAIGSGRG